MSQGAPRGTKTSDPSLSSQNRQGSAVPQGTERKRCLLPQKAGHWVSGLQAVEPCAADAAVQGTLAIRNDNTK